MKSHTNQAYWDADDGDSNVTNIVLDDVVYDRGTENVIKSLLNQDLVSEF